MSIEDRLKMIIGDLVVRLALMETEKAAMAAELEQLKKQQQEKSEDPKE